MFYQGHLPFWGFVFFILDIVWSPFARGLIGSLLYSPTFCCQFFVGIGGQLFHTCHFSGDLRLWKVGLIVTVKCLDSVCLPTVASSPWSFQNRCKRREPLKEPQSQDCHWLPWAFFKQERYLNEVNHQGFWSKSQGKIHLCSGPRRRAAAKSIPFAAWMFHKCCNSFHWFNSCTFCCLVSACDRSSQPSW